MRFLLLWGRMSGREVVAHSPLCLATLLVAEEPGESWFLPSCRLGWLSFGVSLFCASAGNLYLLPRVIIVFPVHKGIPGINEYIFSFVRLRAFIIGCVSVFVHRLKKVSLKTAAFFS